MARGLSINIGLNVVDPDHYNGWDGRLAACEYDARDMAAIAEDKGFESRLLLTQDATADAVTDAIRQAASDLSGEDILFVSYSGHGGQIPDVGRDEDTDDQDETWVLYDRQLLDDELNSLWAEFQAGVRIFMLSDSCHSGTVARAMFDEVLTQETARRGFLDDESPRTKDLPLDTQEATYRQHKDAYDEIQSSHPEGDEVEVAASVILISGCQDNQLSLDGRRNGLFTQTLLKVWSEGRFEGRYRRFWKAIAKQMPPSQIRTTSRSASAISTSSAKRR